MRDRLQKVQKALLPPVDLGKLRFRGGWFALPIYLVVVSMYPLSLQHADWVEISEQFWWIAITGVLVGTLLGNGRMRFPRAILAGSTLGMLMIVLSTTFASTGGARLWGKLAHLAGPLDKTGAPGVAGAGGGGAAAFGLVSGG